MPDDVDADRTNGNLKQGHDSMDALLIDDSRAMRRILAKTVAPLGFNILEAGDGQEGLDQWRRNPGIEIVLVDWNMPVMNGLEFVKAVRASEGSDHQKIIMVTTESEPSQMARALMAGVDEFLMKPFTPDMLVDKMNLIGVTLADSSSV